MKIKTYPLSFTEDKLAEIRTAAEKQDKSIRQFLLDLIDKELNKNKEIIK